MCGPGQRERQQRVSAPAAAPPGGAAPARAPRGGRRPGACARPGSGPRSAARGGAPARSGQQRQRHAPAARAATSGEAKLIADTAPELQPARPASVDSAHVIDAQPPQLARDRCAALALELGEALANPPSRGVDLERARRSRGRPAARRPTAGSSASRGSPTSTASRRGAARSDAERALPVRAASRKSEIDDDQAGLARPARPTRVERAGQGRRIVRRRRARRPRRAAGAARRCPGLAPRGGSSARLAGAEGDQRRRCRRGARRGARTRARRPRRRRPSAARRCRTPSTARRRARSRWSARARGRAGARAARRCARGRGRVDVADVVAELVRAQLGQLDARRRPRRPGARRAACRATSRLTPTSSASISGLRHRAGTLAAPRAGRARGAHAREVGPRPARRPPLAAGSGGRAPARAPRRGSARAARRR